jgi:hypothetical protein
MAKNCPRLATFWNNRASVGDRGSDGVISLSFSVLLNWKGIDGAVR